MSDAETFPLDPALRTFADRLDGRFALWAGDLTNAIADASAKASRTDLLDRLYAKTPSIWSEDPEVQQKIANRLGWLSAPAAMEAELPRVEAFARSVRDRGITDVVLLGMGGSSLAPEVIRAVVGVQPGWPRFHMLDSTDPDAVRAVDGRIALASTLFLLASKSGGTVEPNSMAAHFKARLIDAGITPWAARFVAITDPGTGLFERARHEGFLETFVNPPDIGGRYSAVSLFGLVPAALIGVDVRAYLNWARAMLWLCNPTRPLGTNPAFLLGAAMASGALAGRDKMTLVVPPALDAFGLWAEQLVAESTGKQGRGVIPVAGETLGGPDVYGEDRLFVSLTVSGEAGAAATAEALRAVTAAGAPWADMVMPAPEALGAEFVRWKLATAIAGALMGVNPFDEPNVAQAKAATQRLLDGREASGVLPEPDAALPFTIGGARAWASRAAREALGSDPATGIVGLARPGEYVAILAYLGPDQALVAPLGALREAIRENRRVATTFGYGPRYLHSTGQLHKGGADNGVFVIVFGDSSADLPVPDTDFTFQTLEHAQALGDFASLDAAGRRAIAVKLSGQSPVAVEAFCAALGF